MLRKIGFVLVVCLLLAACSGKQDEKKTPTAIPSATPAIAGYTGPQIGSLTSQTGASADCSEGSGCLDIATEQVQVSDEPLPLIPQTVGAFGLGIPEGYSPLTLSDEIVITAVSAETLGSFSFSVREVTEEALNKQLARFDNPDLNAGKSIETETLKGQWVDVKNGAIGVLEAANGQKIFVEAAANEQYWLSFRPTFEAMLASLAYTP